MILLAWERSTVKAKVALGEFHQRFSAFQRSSGWNPFFEESIGELFATASTAADQTLQFGVHDDIGQALSILCRNARFPERGAQFVARQLSIAL